MTGMRPQQRQRRIRNQDHRCPPLLRIEQLPAKVQSGEKRPDNSNLQKLSDR